MINKYKGINWLIIIAFGFTGILSAERVVYPYRFDPSEHPDYSLRHYQGPTWDSIDGRIIGATELVADDMHKITRIAGIDKNSFPANLDLDKFHEKIENNRKKYGTGYAGHHIGESDGGFIHFNQHYQHPFSRSREMHHLSFADFLDSYGRITDYQLSWGINQGLAHAAHGEGYLTLGSFQAHHGQFFQVVHAFLRGSAKQYGMMLRAGLTDTYQKSSDAFRKKNLDDHELAKEKLANMDPDKVTWKEKFDVMATLRRANEALDPDGSPFSYSYRFWYAAYQHNFGRFNHLEGLSYRDVGKNREERELTELGKLHEHFENDFMATHPDPGGMYAAVAFMVDYFNGWVGWDHGIHKNLEGIVWDGVPFDRSDFQLTGFFKIAYPDYIPKLSRKTNTAIEGGFSRTPFGDCVEVIRSDARPELLKQYGLVVLAGEFSAELPLVRDKLTAYIKQGGQVFLCAEQARAIWPDRAAVQGNEIVEVSIGKGILAISPSPYGLREVKSPTEGNYPLQLQDQIKEYLRGKMKELQLFSVGENLATIVNRNADGVYTLGVYNGHYKSLPFSIESHIGDILRLKEIPTGDVDLIKADSRFYAPREVTAGSWGSSDAKTIGGGEVRLFEIKVKELNVRVLDKVEYPNRPNRYLAVGMKHLRRKIQLRPSFFQQFSGVKVDALDLLGTDDEALKYEHGWYRVRHLEVLVDIDGVKDENTRKEVMRRMALLPYAKILDSDANIVIQTDGGVSSDLSGIGNCKPGKPYLALRQINDIAEWLGNHPGFFKHFSGIMLESDYLFQRDATAWKKESDMLRQHGIGVIVDFSSRMRMYRDISYRSTMPFARLGEQILANVLKKMEMTNIHDAVFLTTRNWDNDASEALAGFATKAAQYDISLHLRLAYALQVPGKMRTALKKVDQPNLFVAWNPLVNSRSSIGSPVEIALLSTPGVLATQLLPAHFSELKKSGIKELNSCSTIIFDAEYLDWNEIQADVVWWNN